MRKYADGDWLNAKQQNQQSQLAPVYGAIGNTANTFLQPNAGENGFVDWNNQSNVNKSIGGETLQYAGQGAALGANPALVAASGGLSVPIGAVIGAGVGFFKGKQDVNKNKNLYNRYLQGQQTAMKAQGIQNYQSNLQQGFEPMGNLAQSKTGFKKGGLINPKKNSQQTGGSQTSFADGGDMLDDNKPIYTSNPNDPRLRAYNDSNNLYNLGVNLENKTKKWFETGADQKVIDSRKEEILTNDEIIKRIAAEKNIKHSSKEIYKGLNTDIKPINGKVIHYDIPYPEAIRNEKGGLKKDKNGKIIYKSVSKSINNYLPIYKQPSQPYKLETPIIKKQQAIPYTREAAIKWHKDNKTPLPKGNPEDEDNIVSFTPYDKGNGHIGYTFQRKPKEATSTTPVVTTPQTTSTTNPNYDLDYRAERLRERQAQSAAFGEAKKTNPNLTLAEFQRTYTVPSKLPKYGKAIPNSVPNYLNSYIPTFSKGGYLDDKPKYQESGAGINVPIISVTRKKYGGYINQNNWLDRY